MPSPTASAHSQAKTGGRAGENTASVRANSTTVATIATMASRRRLTRSASQPTGYCSRPPALSSTSMRTASRWLMPTSAP